MKRCIKTGEGNWTIGKEHFVPELGTSGQDNVSGRLSHGMGYQQLGFREARKNTCHLLEKRPIGTASHSPDSSEQSRAVFELCAALMSLKTRPMPAVGI